MRNKQVSILIKGEEKHRLGHQNKAMPKQISHFEIYQFRIPDLKLNSVPLGFPHFKRIGSEHSLFCFQSSKSGILNLRFMNRLRECEQLATSCKML